MSIFFANEVIILLSISFLTTALLFGTTLFGVYIYKKWDFNAATTTQYKIEKQSYLIMLILFFALIVKIVMFPYFAFTIDSLSDIVSGAMCAAGVIQANPYGSPLLGLKILIIFLVGYWLIVNRLDIKAIDYPYMKKKLLFALFIFLLVSVELYLEIKYFSHIVTDIPVQCCSVIYTTSAIDNPLAFGFNMQMLLIVFYTVFILSIAANILKNRYFSLAMSVVFFYFAYYALTYFFGTYIYQLPTHICPFCMLRADYYFIGYLLWGSLFLGSFFGSVNGILYLLTRLSIQKYYLFSTLLYLLFTTVCTSYVIFYFFENKVFL